MQEIVELYRRYNKFDECSDAELRLYLFTSMNLGQYKKHYVNDELIGFTNWAFLSDEAQARFKKTGIINKEDWLSGNHLWHIETICKSNLKDIMKWTKKFFTEKFGLGKEINWIRIKDNKILRIVKRKTKESWL